MHFCSVAYFLNGQPYRYDFGTDRRCNIVVHLALQAKYPGAVLTSIRWIVPKVDLIAS